MTVYDSKTGETVIDIMIDDFLLKKNIVYHDTTSTHKQEALPDQFSRAINYLQILAEPTVGSK
jgi:hypothetical protein